MYESLMEHKRNATNCNYEKVPVIPRFYSNTDLIKLGNKLLFFQQEKETVIIPNEKSLQLQKDEAITPLPPRKENDGKYHLNIFQMDPL